MRTNLKESLLKKLIYNEKRQQDSIKLFEISDIYTKINKISSARKIGIIASGRMGKNYINFSKKIDEKYFQKLISEILETKHISFEVIDRKNINSKIKEKIIYFEANIDDISDNILNKATKFKYPNEFIAYQKISEQPSSYRDISYSISEADDFMKLDDLISNYNNKYLKDCFMFDYYLDNKAGLLKVAYRFIFQSKSETLQENQVDEILNDIISITTKPASVDIPGMNL